MVLVYSEEKDVSKQLLGLAHSLAGAATQTALGPHHNRLLKTLKDVARTELHALFTRVASFLVHVHEVYFKGAVLFGHACFLFRSIAGIGV